MDGDCQVEYLHSTEPKLHGERVNITFRWIKNHVPQCPVGAGCCIACPHVLGFIRPCQRGLPVDPARMGGGGEGGGVLLAAVVLEGLWQRKSVVFWVKLWCSIWGLRLSCRARELPGTWVGRWDYWDSWTGQDDA